MIALEEKQPDGVFRKPSLIAGATKKMALTYVFGAVCAASIAVVDSLIAGVSIGQEALAAIAAAGPLLSIDQILHCMLGFGIEKLMVQAIGEGDHKKADRIFGAILIAVLVVYGFACGVLLIIQRPLLRAIMGDSPLVDMTVRYTAPLLIFAAFSETLLCIERAFRIDGRAKLFSMRSIVTNIANIVFDILMVSVFNLGISGLALASVISVMLGYTVTLSHFFSKKRTVSPDFSVIRSRKELLGYVKQDMRLGSSATLDEVMDSMAISAQTAAIGAIGGPGGLAIWTVFKSLRGVVISAGNGVSASVSVHTGLLFGQKDYDGVRYSVRSGIRTALLLAMASMQIMLMFASPLADIYKIDPEIQTLGAQCLRIGCLAFPAIVFLNVLTIYLPSVNETKLAGRLVFLEHCLAIVAAAIGASSGVAVFFLVYVIAVVVTSLVATFMLVRNKHWFVPKSNPAEIVGYSICLEPDQIEALRSNLDQILPSKEYPYQLCSRVSLVVEESLSYIAQQNTGSSIDVDVGVKQEENGLLVMITDSGRPYNPLAETTTRDITKSGVLETRIFLGYSEEVDYDRVLDLNRISLHLVAPEAT